MVESSCCLPKGWLQDHFSSENWDHNQALDCCNSHISPGLHPSRVREVNTDCGNRSDIGRRGRSTGITRAYLRLVTSEICGTYLLFLDSAFTALFLISLCFAALSHFLNWITKLKKDKDREMSDD